MTYCRRQKTTAGGRPEGKVSNQVDWIWANVCHLQFESVLDVFGGTGAVSHMFKNAGKKVVYNDLLAFNRSIGLELIENSRETIADTEIECILRVQGHLRRLLSHP